MEGRGGAEAGLRSLCAEKKGGKKKPKKKRKKKRMKKKKKGEEKKEKRGSALSTDYSLHFCSLASRLLPSIESFKNLLPSLSTAFHALLFLQFLTRGKN